MTESPPTESAQQNHSKTHETKRPYEEIPIEIVSQEEMALIEAAMVSARSLCLSSSSRRFQANVRSVRSITALSKRGFQTIPDDEPPDLEDLGAGGFRAKRTRLPDSLLSRYRKNKCLAVTDFTSSEWCEKQMEFSLSFKKEPNKAMKAGIKRHACLEEEVVTKVKVYVESAEDRCALKLINFIIRGNQLLTEGLTRELPIISYVEGIWMVGVIDEIRMPNTETERYPLLVDTKTRGKPTCPSEPQQRNGRFQLMFYKHMWDSLVSVDFPTKKFFEYLSLNPYGVLSKDIIETTVNMGLPAKTLEDVMRMYTNLCSMLPVCQDDLLLRYESQADHSVMWEDKFTHDPTWMKNQIHTSLEFLRGERKASYVPEEELWKCRFCQYKSKCTINDATSSQDL